MILLDTDHITVLAFPEHSQFQSLRERIDKTNGEIVAITVINIEEPLRGWLAEINRRSGRDRLLPVDPVISRLRAIGTESDADTES